MTETLRYGNLTVAKELDEFLRTEVIDGIGVDADHFWNSLETILDEFGPRNKELLQKREDIQDKIDQWHLSKKGEPHDQEAYISFLKEIGYLLEEGDDFEISTDNVDDEIKTIAGAQLVVPVMNARFSLNAANARWGSLYDALYGTDMISEEGGAERGGAYNPVRGDKVIEFSKNFLDETIALSSGSYAEVTGFKVSDNNLDITLTDQSTVGLKDEGQFVGYIGDPDNPSGILLKNNNLHIEIQVDKEDSVGKDDPAGIKDVMVESAVTTIQDLEDSVAAVDAEDKTIAYRNWLGLMKGDLKETFVKGDQEMTRSLNADREYTLPDGESLTLPGRSVLLVGNVGHLMTNPAVLDKEGSEIPEGILDAMFTICIAKHDLMKTGSLSNSRTGSVYIVKPKMHGPEEVAFTDKLFSKVEETLSLKKYTMKVGIMDEERRTTVNLKECIRQVKNRIVFINTGFLDRTGDEMHTSFEAGPMIFKGEMKKSTWLNSYENWNVDIGLSCGFSGKAQIGKGMWAAPDEMKKMLEEKIGHLKAGANCAWVPSPTAASLHALHYHEINVFDVQKKLTSRSPSKLEDLLTIPVADRPNWSVDEINSEISNSAQTLLGYVVRWIDQGVGCSKVPDINNIGLMEDRATCRISSQAIVNWIANGLITKELSLIHI